MAPQGLVFRGAALGLINGHRRDLGLGPLSMRDVEAMSLWELVVMQDELRKRVESGGGLFPPRVTEEPGAGRGGPAPGRR